MLASRVRAGWVLALLVAGVATAACGSDDAAAHNNVTLTYCDVAPILENKCQRCHQIPGQHGAPFPLLTYADTQADAPLASEPERKRWQDMLKAVEDNTMPFRGVALDPPVSPLTCMERATLLAWLGKGTPAAPEGQVDCVDVSPTLLSCGN